MPIIQALWRHPRPDAWADIEFDAVGACHQRATAMPNHAPQPTIPQAGRAIITIIGSDRVGIIAGIVNVLADANVNILDISQSVIREFFTMIMMVDLESSTVSFHELSEQLTRKSGQLAVRVEIQREEIFKAMHRI